MFQKTFKSLALSQVAHDLFVALLEHGPSTARFLADRLSLPRPSVYDHLAILIERGLVTEQESSGKKVFQIENVTNVSRLLAEKIDNLKKEQRELDKALPLLSQKELRSEPRIKFYSGVDGIKVALNQVLYSGEHDSISMWPIDNIARVLGKEYFLALDEKRLMYKMRVRGIWPHSIDKEHRTNFLKVGPAALGEVRKAPKKLGVWHMGYWLSGDRAAFISSEHELYGFVIQSKDFTDMLRDQFNFVWSLSKPLTKK